MNQPGKTDKNNDRLCKITSLSDTLSNSYAKFYNPSEHLSVDEVIVLFKGRVIFKQYIPKKQMFCCKDLTYFTTLLAVTWKKASCCGLLER
jgi:hypothetical protein